MKYENLIIGRFYQGNFGHGNEICKYSHEDEDLCFFQSQDKSGFFLILKTEIKNYDLMEVL